MIVSNQEEWLIRNTKVEKLIKEKQEQINQLNLEIFTLSFSLNRWKQYPFIMVK